MKIQGLTATKNSFFVVLFFCAVFPGRCPGLKGSAVLCARRIISKLSVLHGPGEGRKFLIAAAALFSVYLLVSFVLGEMGLVKYYRMKAQYNSLTDDIAALKQDNAKLSREVHLLKTDPACIERIARDKLGLARPGEIVYYYKAIP